MGLNFALTYMFNIWCDNVCFLAKSKCTTCNETKLVLKSMEPKGVRMKNSIRWYQIGYFPGVAKCTSVLVIEANNVST